MVQERRSMLRVWNVILIITTFFLTIFGTFMTRSGVVQSVHAFGDDPMLAKLFTAFMVTILTFSFGLVIHRLPLLKARNELDSWASREAAFLVNNWILLFAAMFVLFGTMFPTLSEAITGQRLTVAAPFFNKWMAPVGLILLMLTGVGPLLAWRKSALANLRDQFMWPVLSGLVTGGAMVALGIPIWAAGLCFALCGLVIATIVQEFWRGGKIRRKNTGTDMVTAIIGLVGRNKRRYGGYIVHVGVVFICLGFAGNGSKKDLQVLLKPGQEASLGRYVIRNDGVRVTDDGQKQAVTASLSVFVNGKQIDSLYPAKWFFRRHESEPTTEVAIRRTLAEDLYVVMAAPPQIKDQSASLEIFVNPLVNWIWIGFGVIALGTGIALLPERAYSFAIARLPVEAPAASTVALLLALLLLNGTSVFAQHMPGSRDENIQSSYYPRNDFEKQLQHEIVCTCGTCGHANIGECRKDPCGTSHQMRAELAALVDQKKSHDEIIQWFVTKYGDQRMLGAPIDQGFARLAWLFPYLVGASGAVAVGFVAVRWSRHQDAPAEALPPVDTELDDRIDDELRDLD
jgi:cytochrome c-type biogenesis protein CcmF